MKSKIFYRGDKELYLKAKEQAKKEGRAVGFWIDLALQEKLNKKERRYKT